MRIKKKQLKNKRTNSSLFGSFRRELSEQFFSRAQIGSYEQKRNLLVVHGENYGQVKPSERLLQFPPEESCEQLSREGKEKSPKHHCMQIYARTLGIWFSGMNAKQGLLLFFMFRKGNGTGCSGWCRGCNAAASVSNNSIMEIVVDWSGNDDEGNVFLLISKKR